MGNLKRAIKRTENHSKRNIDLKYNYKTKLRQLNDLNIN